MESRPAQSDKNTTVELNDLRFLHQSALDRESRNNYLNLKWEFRCLNEWLCIVLHIRSITQSPRVTIVSRQISCLDKFVSIAIWNASNCINRSTATNRFYDSPSLSFGSARDRIDDMENFTFPLTQKPFIKSISNSLTTSIETNNTCRASLHVVAVCVRLIRCLIKSSRGAVLLRIASPRECCPWLVPAVRARIFLVRSSLLYGYILIFIEYIEIIIPLGLRGLGCSQSAVNRQQQHLCARSTCTAIYSTIYLLSLRFVCVRARAPSPIQLQILNCNTRHIFARLIRNCGAPRLCRWVNAEQ